jgi:hypothetical protein
LRKQTPKFSKPAAEQNRGQITIKTGVRSQ